MSTQEGIREGIRLQMQQKEIRRSSRRQTPISSFAEQFKQGMATGANVVGNVAATAGYAIPGGAVVSAALNSAGTVKSTGDSIANPGVYGQSDGPGLGTAGLGMGGSLGGPMDAVAGRAQAGDPNAQMMMATRQMQELNQQFNLQFLQLQQKMQHESRAYTVMSNIMKQKHDTSRNTLSNLK